MSAPSAKPSPSDRYFVGLTYHRAKNAFWLGLFSVFCCGLFLGIPAIWVGAQALSEIKASRRRLRGTGTAWLGIVLGVIGTVTPLGPADDITHRACHRIGVHRVHC